MSPNRRRAALLILLLATAAWWGWSSWRHARRGARTVAYVTCPFGQPPKVVLHPELMSPWDTLPARRHEEVHAAQCSQLGPVRYRLRSLIPSGKLELEAPAYCASAVARLTFDPDSQYASDRVHEDMIVGMSAVADSEAVKAALMRHCPAIASQPRRTRGVVKRRATRDTASPP